jgi:hypothetical protein
MHCTIHTKSTDHGLHEIEDLQRKMKSKSLVRLFCCMHAGDDNYVYSMENLENIWKSYLEKVQHIVSEKHLADEIFRKFKNDTAKILHDSAVIRKEQEWAGHFLRKL